MLVRFCQRRDGDEDDNSPHTPSLSLHPSLVHKPHLNPCSAPPTSLLPLLLLSFLPPKDPLRTRNHLTTTDRLPTKNPTLRRYRSCFEGRVDRRRRARSSGKGIVIVVERAMGRGAERSTRSRDAEFGGGGGDGGGGSGGEGDVGRRWRVDQVRRRGGGF